MELLPVILTIALVLLATAAISAVLRLQTKLSRSEEERRKTQASLLEARSEYSALEAKLAAKAEMLESIRQHHAEDMKQMKEVFENLSNKNSAEFKQRSAETIGDLLKPVQEKFREFSESVRQSQKESADRHSKLEQKIIDLDARSISVGNEARNLANALTGYSKVQGDFGEMLLVDVLKNAGLTEGIHFSTQSVITDSSGREIKSESGRTMIPDVIVFYPDDTTVIIDSKVSLKAYQEFMSASTAADRKTAAKAHVDSIRNHVNELRTKDYTGNIPEGKRKVEYNIMFIPIEGAFTLMLDEDPRLWQVARENNVLIVSQMTLIIVLNMIQMSWKQYEQEKNIADVYKTAEELMSQLKAWLESYVKVGQLLDKAGTVYNESLSKLKDSNQSVIKKIEKLEKLGLSPKRSNARIKTTSRQLSPAQTIIPLELSDNK